MMMFSYCVRSIYVESCSMFVRGGVYRVVKEALGGTLAKFSVSALMFDYVLTGPISGVAAGQYLAGVINEVLSYAHISLVLNTGATAAFFAVLVTVYFWWQNIKGIPESSHKALRIMQLTTVMVVLLIGWCLYTVFVRHPALPPAPWPRNIRLDRNSLGWLYGKQIVQMIPMIAVFVGLGHSVLAMSGEESLAQVYREIEHPKLPNLKKAGLVIFRLQPPVYVAGFDLCGDDHSRRHPPELPRKPDRRPGHEPGRARSRCGCCSISSWSWWAP